MTLNGVVFANGENTTAIFQYSQITDYELSPPAIEVLETNTEPEAVQHLAEGLTSYTLYHFRVRATHPNEDTAYGNDLTFFFRWELRRNNEKVFGVNPKQPSRKVSEIVSCRT